MIILDKFLNGWDRLWWTCAVSARNGHQGLSATDDRQGWARRLQTTCCGGNCFSLSESEECVFVDRELNPKHVHLHKIQPSVISTFLSNIRKRRRASNLCYYLCNEQLQDWSRGRGWIKENVDNLYFKKLHVWICVLAIKTKTRQWKTQKRGIIYSFSSVGFFCILQLER